MIHLIACIGENNEIGLKNDMPWGRNLPADLAYFEKTTTGHTVVMGRKTFETIGKPLKNRRNVILTRDASYRQEGCVVVNSMEEILDSKGKGEQFFVIGGADIYKQFLPFADFLYLTKIKQGFDADTYFPKVDIEKDYKMVQYEKGKRDEKNQFDYGYYLYEKNK